MVTNEVKKRLDHQVALQNLHRRMEQEHLVNWVEQSVIKSIPHCRYREYGHSIDTSLYLYKGSICLKLKAFFVLREEIEYEWAYLKG